MSITAYPLSWPTGWKRTPSHQQEAGRFGVRKPSRVGSCNTLENITISEATNRLLNELERMGVERGEVVLSTNLMLRLDGLPRSGQAEPHDPGAAVYWRDPFNSQPRSMAIDRYNRVAQNIAALAATIEALRAIERHGGAVVLERAFTGFAALPAPIAAGMHRPWREVLGLGPGSPSKEQVREAYGRLASQHHPDRGGSAERMAEINLARNEAMQEITNV
jgi:hypothetical protein